jgi:hypothetical protein
MGGVGSGGRGGGTAIEILVYLRKELGGGERLAEVAVEARLEDPVLVLLERLGGERQDGEPRRDALMRRMASIPSIPGMRMSMMTRSGDSMSAMETAS